VLRNWLITFLRREDYSLLEADNAAEALELSSNYEGIIDLLITKESLKNTTGQKVAETIRERRASLKFLQISDNVSAKPGEKAEMKPDNFLSTPFLPEILIARVKETLQSTQTLN